MFTIHTQKFLKFIPQTGFIGNDLPIDAWTGKNETPVKIQGGWAIYANKNGKYKVN